MCCASAEGCHELNEGEAYAAKWVEAWNSNILERVLELWADEMDFCSPLAAEITGSASLQGKDAVASYWRTALAQAGHLHFKLVQALWDPEARTATILYHRHRGSDLRLAAEVIRLNAAGLGVHGIALHGAALG